MLGLLGAQLLSLVHATKHVLEAEETVCHFCTLAGLLGKGPATAPTTTIAPPQPGTSPVAAQAGAIDPLVAWAPPARAPPYSS